jgi:glucarate dehydratase
MKITDIKATTVSVPLEAPLRHAAGSHPGRFVRTIVRVYTDEGIVGLGEVGGGGTTLEGQFENMKKILIGHDPFNIEMLRWKVSNPILAAYTPMLQVLAPIEFACLDIMGKATNKPVCDLIGGRVRDRIPFAAYVFYRYPQNDKGGEETAEQVVRHVNDLIKEHGFESIKLKAGVFTPKHDVEVTEALRHAFPEYKIRVDPNCVWSVEDALWVARRIEPLDIEYFEDPVWGMAAMARVKGNTSMPVATNHVVVNFDQLAPAIRMNAVDIVLIDPHFWGGITAAKRAAVICDTFGLGVSMHSGGELGISLAAMLHLAASLSNLGFAADAHYHHLTDDIIKGGKLKYENGALRVPEGSGLGVEIDEEKLALYEEAFRKEGHYYYNQDPGRPSWVMTIPGFSYAEIGKQKLPRSHNSSGDKDGK